MTLPYTIPGSPEERLLDLRIVWVAKNRGVMKEVRKKFDISPTTVRRVLYGEIETAGHRVEREFARLGAPGFAHYLHQHSTSRSGTQTAA